MAATQMSLVKLGHLTPVAIGVGTAMTITDGNLVPNCGLTLALLDNTDSVSRTVTLSFGSTVDGQVVTPIVWTLAATTKYLVVLGSPAIYGSNTLLTPSNVAVKIQQWGLDFSS